MAEKYMFFNSTPDDRRRHQASDMAEYWSAFLSTGLIHKDKNPLIGLRFDSSVADQLIVTPGQAIMKGHYYALTEELRMPVTSTGEGRIDRLILRWDNNLENRYIRLFIKEGSKNQPPSLERSEKVFEISLFQVLRKPGKAVIEPEDVIDERLDKRFCGIASSLVTVPTEVFIEDWEEFKKKYEKWFLEVQDESFLTVTEHRQSINELQRELAHMKMLQSASYRVKDGATFVTNFQDATGAEVVTIPRVTLSQQANRGSYTINVDRASAISTPGNFTLTSAQGNEVVRVRSKSGNTLTLVNALTRNYPKGSEVSKTQMTIEKNNRRATFGGFGYSQYFNSPFEKIEALSTSIYYDGVDHFHYLKDNKIYKYNLHTKLITQLHDLTKHPEYRSTYTPAFHGMVNGYYILSFRTSKRRLYTINELKDSGNIGGVSYDRVITFGDVMRRALIFKQGKYGPDDPGLVIGLSEDLNTSTIEVLFEYNSYWTRNVRHTQFGAWDPKEEILFQFQHYGTSDNETWRLKLMAEHPDIRPQVDLRIYDYSAKPIYSINLQRVYNIGKGQISRSEMVSPYQHEQTLRLSNWWTFGTHTVTDYYLDQETDLLYLYDLESSSTEVKIKVLNLRTQTEVKNINIPRYDGGGNSFYSSLFVGLPQVRSKVNYPILLGTVGRSDDTWLLGGDLTFGDGIGLLENDLYLRVKNSKNFATWVKTTSATMTEIQAGTITQKATYGRGEYQGIVSTLEPTDEVRLRFRRSSLTTAAQVNEIIGGVE